MGFMSANLVMSHSINGTKSCYHEYNSPFRS